MLAEARSKIARYTPDQAAADSELLLVDLRSVDEAVAVGGYEAWSTAR